MGKNPFLFQTKPLTRLTDIETEEVSLVDKAANKRKFAIIKRDSENTMIDTTAFLDGLITGIQQLTALTEVVKAKVEKSEDVSTAEAVDFKTSMAGILNWATGQMSGVFGGNDSAQPTTETGMAAEVAAQTVAGTASPAGDATAAEDKLHADSVGSEVANQIVAGETNVTGDMTANANAGATDTIREEVSAQTVAGETVVATGKEKPVETNSSGSVINKAKEFTQHVLALAATEPSEEDLEKAMGITEGLFFSGGFSVDAWDIEALAAVVNAICESMYDSSESVEKSAGRILAEVAKKSVAVTKRIMKADYKITSADSKEMKVATMLLKAAKDGMKNKKKPAKDGYETSATDSGKKNTKKNDEVTVTSGVSPAELKRLIDEAVTKALEPVAKKNTELTDQVKKLTIEKADAVQKLNTAVSTTQTRVSSAETTTTSEEDSSVVHVNGLGVSDYNAPKID
jgi:hypothetical protein